VKREITFFQNIKSAGRNGNLLRYHKHTGLDATFRGAKQDKRTNLHIEYYSCPEFQIKWMLDCQMLRSVINSITWDSDDVMSHMFMELCPFCRILN
jgi:hypothetical protein